MLAPSLTTCESSIVCDSIIWHEGHTEKKKTLKRGEETVHGIFALSDCREGCRDIEQLVSFKNMLILARYASLEEGILFS